MSLFFTSLSNNFFLSGGVSVCGAQCADIDTSNVGWCKGTEPPDADESCEDNLPDVKQRVESTPLSINTAKTPARPTRNNMVKTLLITRRPMIPKSEETQTSLMAMNPAKKSTHPMTVNDAKTSTRPMMTKMSNRPMPTTKAAKKSTRLMFPPPRVASSTRLPHPLLRLLHHHLPHVSPIS
jgi:hypothetical protein